MKTFIQSHEISANCKILVSARLTIIPESLTRKSTMEREMPTNDTHCVHRLPKTRVSIMKVHTRIPRTPPVHALSVNKVKRQIADETYLHDEGVEKHVLAGDTLRSAMEVT